MPETLLSKSEEKQLLENLLCDPEDAISDRLLTIHYQTFFDEYKDETNNNQKSN
jgi:hypothetical protein